MAVMYLYIHDPEFLPPTKFELQTPLPPDSKVVSRSEHGVTIDSQTSFALAQPFYDGLGGWKQVRAEAQVVEWTSPRGRLILETRDEGSRIRLLPAPTEESPQ